MIADRLNRAMYDAGIFSPFDMRLHALGWQDQLAEVAVCGADVSRELEAIRLEHAADLAARAGAEWRAGLARCK